MLKFVYIYRISSRLYESIGLYKYYTICVILMKIGDIYDLLSVDEEKKYNKTQIFASV